MSWTDPLQPQESPLPRQAAMGQPPFSPQSPTTHPLSPQQAAMGQPPFPPQFPMTRPLSPQQAAMGQPPSPQQAPVIMPADDPYASQALLRKRYTPEQIRLYFFPFPNREPKIQELKQKRRKLYQQIGALILACLILVVLLVSIAGQGVSYLGLLEFVCIIGSVVLIGWLIKTKLLPLNKELRDELAADAREKEYTRAIRPPDERQYDGWINEISNDIYDKAPIYLRLHEHPDHIAWRQTVTEPYTLPLKEPERFGASIFLEGSITKSDAENEHPPQLRKETKNSPRIIHYSVYVFTALFITEDYIAIYTSTVNLRDSIQYREEFEYCYHQHLSHMLLNVNTISIVIDTTSLIVNSPPPKSIALKESTLSLTFDSGRTIERNISTLHIGNETITKIAYIHEKLTKALKDHERSMTKSFGAAKNLE